MSFNVSPQIVLWIQDFLSNRPQKVFMGNVKSSVRTLNTGAPQDCELPKMQENQLENPQF